MGNEKQVQQGLYEFSGGTGRPAKAPKVHSVSEITRLIKSKLTGEPDLNNIYITGEVFDASSPASGHVYFNLKDNESVIRCVMWKGKASRLDFKLEDGLKVVAFGSIGLYERAGNYQIIVDSLQKEGLGALHQAFERLRKKLEAEGLFAEARKRPIPRYPRVVGLVTSESGAAIKDIIKVAKSRWPQTNILLSPASVQGDAAPAELIRALEILNGMADEERIDVIIVSRGGGSPEDLACFNDEGLARAIAASKVPVVTGIGHEVDRTIADYVADRYAATPSQAAEIIFPDASEVRARVQGNFSLVAARTKAIVTRRRERLCLLMASRVMVRPLDMIEQHRQALDGTTEALDAGVKAMIEGRRHSLALATTALESLDPTAILGRGYSITMDHSGKVVKDPEQVKVGGGIKVIVHAGELDARVEAKRKKATKGS